ncbi:hypothetical protein [Mariniflexile sp.]|uniref:hypothetical protein n=1 Tax=Mariniflexile sp. TaxID=1979402 RepID=UPI0035676E62
MKKLGYIILGIVIGAFGAYFFCQNQFEEVQTKISKPKGVITQERAKKLNDDWTKYRKAAVDSAAKEQGRNQDDRSVYWKLEEVENYLAYAKKESDSLGYDMTGIRVYLGVYGENAGQTKKNLTTMFIVPTGKKSKSLAGNVFFQNNDEDLPVDPLNDGGGSGNGYPQ